MDCGYGLPRIGKIKSRQMFARRCDTSQVSLYLSLRLFSAFLSVSVPQQLHTPTHNLILCLHTQQQFHCLQNNCKPSQQLCPQNPSTFPPPPVCQKKREKRKVGGTGRVEKQGFSRANCWQK